METFRQTVAEPGKQNNPTEGMICTLMIQILKTWRKSDYEFPLLWGWGLPSCFISSRRLHEYRVTVPVKLYTNFRMFLHIVALEAGLMSELLPVRARGMQGEISVMVPCVTPLGYSYVSTNQWWRFNLTNPLRQIIFVR